MDKITWRIYYSDGSTFDNSQGEPSASPPFGVQAIVCLPDLWGCGDFAGLIQYLIEPSMQKCVRFGKLATNDEYDRAVSRARLDPDIDQKIRHIYECGDYYWWRGN